jgi:hypothetical protein
VDALALPFVATLLSFLAARERPSELKGWQIACWFVLPIVVLVLSSGACAALVVARGGIRKNLLFVFAAVPLLALGSLVTTVWTGRYYATRVKESDPLPTSSLFGMPLAARNVDVRWIGTPPSPLPGGDAWYLGEANGTTVLYAGGDPFRVPSSSITLDGVIQPASWF